MNEITESKIQEVANFIRESFTEGVFTSNWVLIEMYHAIGKEILSLGQTKDYIKTLSELTEKSPRTLYRCVQFVRKYPDLSALPEGKSISWHKIVNSYLPVPKEVEGNIIKEKDRRSAVKVICPFCRKQFEALPLD